MFNYKTINVKRFLYWKHTLANWVDTRSLYTVRKKNKSIVYVLIGAVLIVILRTYSLVLIL